MNKIKVLNRKRRKPYISFVLIGLLVIAGVFGPLFQPYDPTVNDLTSKFLPPFFIEGGSAAHLLGTDQLGRDILSRLIQGSRISLVVAAAAILIGCVVGTTLGILAGYFGKGVSAVIMRLTDATLAFPSILLALLLSLSIGTGLKGAVISIAFGMWAKYTRTIRSDVQVISGMNYIEQAKIMGAGHGRIIWKHILPNIRNQVIVMATMDISMAIMAEASLSFLGLSVVPPTASWGQMIADGNAYFLRAWWVSLFPTIATVLSVISFRNLGEWVKERRGAGR